MYWAMKNFYLNLTIYYWNLLQKTFSSSKCFSKLKKANLILFPKRYSGNIATKRRDSLNDVLGCHVKQTSNIWENFDMNGFLCLTTDKMIYTTIAVSKICCTEKWTIFALNCRGKLTLKLSTHHFLNNFSVTDSLSFSVLLP